MASEVRLAIRRLAKEPALALAAVSTLAIGIGACSAMFSIVEAVLLKSMDIAKPQRLVVMWPQFGETAGEFSYNAYLELTRQSATFEGVALSGALECSRKDAPEELLGVVPALEDGLGVSRPCVENVGFEQGP